LPGFDIRTGFMTTPDGVTVAGQPEVASSWFPVNDHPIDKASYSFDVTVPNAYGVVATGVLRNRHVRRGAVGGDDAFWRIIRGWAATKSGGNATTEEFIAFAEQVSGQQLDELLTTWLFTPGKPWLAGSADSAAALSTQAGTSAGDWWQRAQAQHERGRY
jgi:aminopeptidase N